MNTPWIAPSTTASRFVTGTSRGALQGATNRARVHARSRFAARHAAVVEPPTGSTVFTITQFLSPLGRSYVKPRRS